MSCIYLYLNLRRHAPAIFTRVTLLFSCHSYTRRQIRCFTASSQAAVKQQQRPCFPPCYSYTKRQIRCDMSPADTFLFNCFYLIFFFGWGDLRAAWGAILNSYRLGQDSERAKCAVRNISFSRPPAPRQVPLHQSLHLWDKGIVPRQDYSGARGALHVARRCDVDHALDLSVVIA